MSEPLLDYLATRAETADLSGIGNKKVAWAFRAVRPDLRSRGGFRYPWPGQWAEAPGPINPKNTSPCPSAEGDGLCVAKTFHGAAQGGIRFGTLLLVGYTKRDVLAEDEDKLRVRRMYVADLLDIATVLSNLRGSDLRFSNLRFSDLSGSDLRFSDLSGSDLRFSDLSGSNLRFSDLRFSDLRGSDLRGSDLRGSNLRFSDLSGSCYSQQTLWPTGFDPKAAGAVLR